MKLSEFTKKCQTLSHPLRMKIYSHILNCGPVTVQDIASKFRIHPNLARNHLKILVTIELLDDKFVKQKIGPPLRIYSTATNYICVNYPDCPLQPS